MRLEEWEKQHENDVRTLLPAVAAQVAARRAYSQDYGKRGAERLLREASDAHTANVRRTRAVLMGLLTVREKLGADPTYTAARAASDVRTLRAEYERLKADLPRLALKLEAARAADADPVGWAEDQFTRFAALADRLPSLPSF